MKDGFNKTYLQPGFNLLLTLTIAWITGLFLHFLNFPAPYLLGSLLGVWFCGGKFISLRDRLGVPRWFYVTVVLGLAVLLGAMFNPSVLKNVSTWIPSILLMIFITAVATFIGFQFLTRCRHYDKTLAMLCCLPGGQAEVVAISRDLVKKDYTVALCHLVRVALVFGLVPLVLTIAEGPEAVRASNQILQSLPSIFDSSTLAIAQFVGLALAGFFIGKLLRLPMPHLLGPLILSASLHIFGWINVPRFNEFVLLAQLAVGGSVGARLAKVPFAEITRTIVDGLMSASLTISIYCIAAIFLSIFFPVTSLNLFLAFIPGGLYEVTLLGLIFGLDIVFITLHHGVRVLIIFFSLPFLMRWVRSKQFS